MLEYHGYTGQVEFDGEAGLFHGEVLDTRDVITFQGTNVKELEQAFADLPVCEVHGFIWPWGVKVVAPIWCAIEVSELPFAFVVCGFFI